jgi:hypothetical protein
MFHQTTLDFQDSDIFNTLADQNVFTNLAKGRKTGILVDCKNNLIPIIRTTTVYLEPPRKFSSIHHNIIEKIKQSSNIPNLQLNQAMIEMYNCDYRTMKFHTDQALDLADNSYICVFSCYNNPATNNIRKLRIKSKITNEINEIDMTHNSVIIFSTKTNKENVHQIVLENEKQDKNTIWLGITFRLSKTFVHFIEQIPLLYPSNIPLRLATDEEKQTFFIYKSQENSNIDFNYLKNIDYTLSAGDLSFF